MTEQIPKPKRFYETVTVEHREGRYCVLLDGRQAKTPAQAALHAPLSPLAEAVAEEWRGQGETMDRAMMPLTALLTLAIDQGAESAPAWKQQIVDYSKSDLVCYRAEAPAELVTRQAKIWDPYIAWAEAAFGAKLLTTNGIVAVNQPLEAITGVERNLDGLSREEVLGLKVLTEIAGSALIALRLHAGDVSPDEAFAASRVDETFQVEKWGEDEEAPARQEGLLRDFEVAARFLRLSTA